MDALEALHHSQDIFKISGCLAPTPTFWISQLGFDIKHLIFKSGFEKSCQQLGPLLGIFGNFLEHKVNSRGTIDL